jgi:peptide/nickel transport system permease protein
MSRLGIVGVIIITFFFGISIFAPWVAPYDPRRQVEADTRLTPDERLRPTREHPFGLDDLGRDVMSRVIFGARISMRVGVTVVLISGLIGLMIGAFSGFYGSWLDTFFSGFLFNVFLAFPSLLLAIAMVAFLGPGLGNLILALSVIGWVGYARLIRGQVLKIKSSTT